MEKKVSGEKIIKYLPYLSLLGFFLTWQCLVDFGIIPRALLASPSEVLKLFIYKLTNAQPDGAVLWVHIMVSLEEALLGYILALVISFRSGYGLVYDYGGLISSHFRVSAPYSLCCLDSFGYLLVWNGFGE